MQDICLDILEYIFILPQLIQSRNKLDIIKYKIIYLVFKISFLNSIIIAPLGRFFNSY